MAGIQRVLVVVACGCLMALAALAGQVGYDDDFGRKPLPDRAAAPTKVIQSQGRDMTTVHINRYGTEKL